MNVLLVVLGGIVGAVARVALDSWVTHRWAPRWPVGTLLINVSGSLLLGIVTGLSLAHGLPAQTRLLIGTGFCGAYTTFSTASFEVVRLAEERRATAATAYAIGGAGLSLLGALVGLALTGGLG